MNRHTGCEARALRIDCLSSRGPEWRCSQAKQPSGSKTRDFILIRDGNSYTLFHSGPDVYNRATAI
jgi:hypothetical protein